MLAIYGRKGDPRLTEMRTVLHSAGIPCILVGPEFGFASIVHRVPFVCFAAGADPFAEGLRQKLSPEKILRFEDHAPTGAIVDVLCSAYLRRFGHDMDHAHENGIRFDGRQVYFRAHLLHLTASEYRIVRLMFHSRGAYFTGDEIAAACLSDGQRGAAVHTCNINSKARFVLNTPLIETRRYSGYRIP